MTPRRFSRAIALLIGCFCLLIGARFTQGQGDSSCPALVNEALTRTTSLCGATGRNEVCYGNDSMQTEPSALLDAPGDITAIDQITRLSLGALDDSTHRWGVAMARLQVNLPDTLPGENVTFLLYGDAIFEPLVSADAPGAVPVNAFRLKTGITGMTCGQTAMNGLLVQTPDSSSAQKIAFTLNGVEVRMGSTVAFSASAADGLIVRVIEGAALIESDGVQSIAVAGSQVTVPLDESLAAAGVPSLPIEYDAQWVEFLPIDPLEREIEIAAPLDETALDDLIAAIEDETAIEDLETWFEDGDYNEYIADPDDAIDDDAIVQTDEFDAPLDPTDVPPEVDDGSGSDDDGWLWVG
ncbi:MAG: hypothetical protein SGJ24_16640 [Chloroflexota bacterium]|nr:hypothetical protein [Chloroflexota bacterium]